MAWRFPKLRSLMMLLHGPLTRYVRLWVAHAPGMPGTFSRPPRVSDPDMHHGTCVTHVPWCMPGSLTSGFLWIRWRGKRSRHSRRMRNPHFYESGKKPMETRSALPAFSRRINRSPIGMNWSVAKGLVMQSLDVFFIVSLDKFSINQPSCVWIEAHLLVHSLHKQPVRRKKLSCYDVFMRYCSKGIMVNLYGFAVSGSNK